VNKLRLSRIEGKQIDLRLVRLDDAAFIHGLRTDQSLNEYLSEVTGSVEDQRRWIIDYKERELFGCEYYFIIERKDGVRCGVVRLYNIKGDRFTWGSWILDHNKPRKAALESALLSFNFGFETIGLAEANLEVRVNNTRAIEFYRRFGMIEINRTEQEIFFLLPRLQFDADKGAFSFILENENTNV
jgi:RimJ/RimL family protein N-acetyltransferase